MKDTGVFAQVLEKTASGHFKLRKDYAPFGVDFLFFAQKQFCKH